MIILNKKEEGILVSLGENIKEIRKNKGYTQKQLAEKLGTSPQNLAQYENGKRQPKLETIKKMADALECSVADLDDSITEKFQTKFDVRKYITAIDKKIILKNFPDLQFSVKDSVEDDDIDYFWEWLEKNGIKFTDTDMTICDIDDFCIEMDKKVYLLNIKQISAIENMSIEQIKTMIRVFDKINKEAKNQLNNDSENNKKDDTE